MLGLSGLGGIEDLQAALGVRQTSEWDQETLAAMSTYQGRNQGELQMHVTGTPDPATLINLGYYDPLSELPRRQAEFLSGDGPQPTTLWRDLATLSNQVPQWIWLLMGGGMLAVGYYVHRKKG